MPYISPENRRDLDPAIEAVLDALADTPFQDSLGNLNYLISRIVAGHMGQVSYGKVAMATGVLENVKQEFYRRVAAPYEDQKIDQSGDIPEYS